jgi:hypothetical protein
MRRPHPHGVHPPHPVHAARRLAGLLLPQHGVKGADHVARLLPQQVGGDEVAGGAGSGGGGEAGMASRARAGAGSRRLRHCLLPVSSPRVNILAIPSLTCSPRPAWSRLPARGRLAGGDRARAAAAVGAARGARRRAAAARGAACRCARSGGGETALWYLKSRAPPANAAAPRSAARRSRAPAILAARALADAWWRSVLGLEAVEISIFGSPAPRGPT